MTTHTQMIAPVEDRWPAGGPVPGDALGQVLLASHLLGADRSVANFGGGNTSAKGRATDHVGREVDVMWVKGSGSDLATGEVGDHLLVAHLLALEHRQRLIEPQRREVLAPHRRQITPRPLHPHHIDLTTHVIDRAPLRRRVAATEVRHRPIGPEQVRSQQHLLERIAGELGVGRRDQLHERGHAVTPPRSAVIRSA